MRKNQKLKDGFSERKRNYFKLLYLYRKIPFEEFLKLEHLLTDDIPFVFVTPQFLRDKEQFRHWHKLSYFDPSEFYKRSHRPKKKPKKVKRSVENLLLDYLKGNHAFNKNNHGDS